MNNYFQLYDIPVSFQPNKNLVKQKFYELSRKHHPDFFTNDTEATQMDALEMAALNNKAFKTLSNPDATLQYVLELNGQLTTDEKYQLPPDFLMEMMELNELVDDATTDAEKAALENSINEQKNAIYAPIEPIITASEANMLTQEALLQVKEYYFKKKYLDRILAGIK